MCNLSQVATEAQSFRVVNQVLIKSSICLIWWATIAHQIKHMFDLVSPIAHQIKHMFDFVSPIAHQIKHMFDLVSPIAHQIEHRIAGWEKTTKLSNFWQFFEQFSHKTSNLYINNTYFAKKIGSYTLSWPVGGLKHFGQSQGVFPPPTQLTNTKITMSNTSRLSRAIY